MKTSSRHKKTKGSLQQAQAREEYSTMTRLTLMFTLTLGLITTTLFGQSEDYKQYLLKQNLPEHFSDVVTAGIDNKYLLSDFIDPFYLVADFNGDNKTDIAVIVKEIKTGKTGIIVFHADEEEHHVIGAGQHTGNGGDDFDWLDIWKVYTDNVLEPGVGELEIIELKGDAIYVAKAEAASAIIYWTGREYTWYHQGD